MKGDWLWLIGAALLTYLIGWIGSLLINVWRAPILLLREARREIEALKHSNLVIHSADFYPSSGGSPKSVKEQLQFRKRDGLIIVASSDALKCDPSPCDDHKRLEVSYSFGDEGPFPASRSQDCPYPLVLPQDRLLLKQIDDNRKLYLAELEKVKALRVAFRESCTLLMRLGVLEKGLPRLQVPE